MYLSCTNRAEKNIMRFENPSASDDDFKTSFPIHMLTISRTKKTMQIIILSICSQSAIIQYILKLPLSSLYSPQKKKVVQ